MEPSDVYPSHVDTFALKFEFTRNVLVVPQMSGNKNRMGVNVVLLPDCNLVWPVQHLVITEQSS